MDLEILTRLPSQIENCIYQKSWQQLSSGFAHLRKGDRSTNTDVDILSSIFFLFEPCHNAKWRYPTVFTCVVATMKPFSAAYTVLTDRLRNRGAKSVWIKHLITPCCTISAMLFGYD